MGWSLTRRVSKLHLASSASLAALLAILALGVTYRGWLAITAGAVSHDASIFAFLLHAWRAEGWQSAALAYRQHLGYPALIACGEFVVRACGATQDPFLATQAGGQLVGVLSGAVAVAGVWMATGLLVRGAAPAAVAAAVAALGVALLPRFSRYCADMLSDPACWAIYLVGLCVAVKAVRQRSFWLVALAAGFAAGAYHVRVEGAGLLLATLAGVVLDRRWAPRGRVAAVTLACLTFAALVAPYVWVSGSLSPKKELLPTELRDHGFGHLPTNHAVTPLAWAMPLGPLEVTGMTSADARPAPTLLGRLAWLPVQLGEQLGKAMQVTWLILAVVGAAALVLQRAAGAMTRPLWPTVRLRGSAARVLLAAGGIQLLAMARLYVWDGYLTDRHALPVALLLMPWAGIGALALAGLARRWKALGASTPGGPSLAGGLAVGGMAIALYAPTLPERVHPDRAYIAQAGAWVRANPDRFGPGKAICDRPWEAYYAGRAWAQPKDMGQTLQMARVVELARSGDCAMLLLDPSFTLGLLEGRLRADGPDFFDRLPPDLFELVQVFPGPSSKLGQPPREVRAYRVLRPIPPPNT